MAGAGTTRRAFLRTGGIIAAGMTMHPIVNAFGASDFNVEETTIAALQAAMQSGRLTAEALTDIYLRRIQALDKSGPTLRSVQELNPDALAIAKTLDDERRAKGARGPLHGIAILLKDNIATADKMENRAGALALVGARVREDAFIAKNGTLPGGNYMGQARMQRFQTLQDPLAPIVPPYHRLPQLNASASYNDVAGKFDTALPGEYVRFVHPTLIEGSRASFAPTLAAPRISPGWYVTPKAGLRYSAYQLERSALGEPANPAVAVPWLSLDSGLVFERGARLFGEALTQTLEPRLFYVYVPYRNQDHIPLFDTTLADFNYPQLFTENRFIGGDRFGDANQATLALTTRFLQGDGQERFRATLGQRFYFHEERVALSPGSTLRLASESDVLTSVGGRVTQAFSFDATTQYNPYKSRAERYGVSMRYAPEIAKVVNASYRFQRDILRQIDVSGQWPVAAGWYGVGRYNYSLLDRRLLEGLAGAEYNAGCWVFRFVVQRIQAAADVTSTAIIFQLEFTGVGQIGTAEAVQLLRRDVPGYSVINRSDPALAAPSARPRLPFEQTF